MHVFLYYLPKFQNVSSIKAHILLFSHVMFQRPTAKDILKLIERLKS